jgi:hypothetical protein
VILEAIVNIKCKLMNKIVLLFVLLSAVFFAETSSAQIPTEGLVGYWPFNGNADDESGYGYNGTVFGATLIPDRFGNVNSAYYFDGINDKITTEQEQFANNNMVSVSLWVKFNQIASTKYFLACADFGVATRFDSVAMAISIPNTNSAFGTPNFDEWSHFAGTYDGNYIRAYINGVYVDSILWPGNIYYFPRPLTFAYFDTYWKGSIDDIRIYDRVLSATEVEILFNESSVGITQTVHRNEIEVFPNPAESFVIVEFNVNNQNYKKVSIMDLLGNVVFDKTVIDDELRIDLDKLDIKGLYFLTVSGKDNKVLSSQKLIIK